MIIKKIEILKFNGQENQVIELSQPIVELSQSQGLLLRSFLQIMLYGEDGGETEGIEGRIWFQKDGEDFRLTRRFHQDSSAAYHELVSETTGAITDASGGSLQQVMNPIGEAVFENQILIRPLSGSGVREQLQSLQNQLSGFTEGMDSALDVGRALQVLKMTRKGYQVSEDLRLKELHAKQKEISAKIQDASENVGVYQKKRQELEETRKGMRFGEDGGRILDQKIAQVKKSGKQRAAALGGAGIFLILLALILYLAVSLPVWIPLIVLIIAVLCVIIGYLAYREMESEIAKYARLKRKWNARRKRIHDAQSETEEDFEEKTREYENLKAEYREYEDSVETVSPEQEEVLALSMAIQRITGLAEQNRLITGRKIEERSSQILKEVTGDVWRVALDGNFRLTVKKNGEGISLSRLTSEEVQMICFAVRMAEGELIQQEKNQFYILEKPAIQEIRNQVMDWIRNSGKQFILY